MVSCLSALLRMSVKSGLRDGGTAEAVSGIGAHEISDLRRVGIEQLFALQVIAEPHSSMPAASDQRGSPEVRVSDRSWYRGGECDSKGTLP